MRTWCFLVYEMYEGTAGPWKIKPHIVILWTKRVIPSRTPSVWPEKAWTEVVLFQQYSKVFPENDYPSDCTNEIEDDYTKELKPPSWRQTLVKHFSLVYI